MTDNGRRENIHTAIYVFSLCSIGVSLPFSSPVNSASVILMTLNWIVEGNLGAKLRSIRRNRLFWAFSVFYFLHIVGLLYTDNLAEGNYQVEKKLALLVLPLVICSSKQLTEFQVNLVLKTFVSSVLLASVICFGYAFHRNNYLEGFKNPVWFYFTYGDLTEVIDMQPNYLAVYVSFSILVLFYFFMTSAELTRPRKAAIVLLAFYLFIFLLLLSTRMPILSFLGIFIVGAAIYFKQRRSLLKGALILSISLTVALLIALQLPIMRERIYQTLGLEQETKWIHQWGGGAGGKVSDRLLKWQCAWNGIKDNVWVGLGTGDDQDFLQVQYQQQNLTTAYVGRFNPHNQYLQTWLALGIPGLTALILCTLWPMLPAWRNRQYLYLSLLIIFTTYCITESGFERQWGLVFFVFFSSILSLQFPAGPRERWDAPKNEAAIGRNL